MNAYKIKFVFAPPTNQNFWNGQVAADGIYVAFSATDALAAALTFNYGAPPERVEIESLGPVLGLHQSVINSFSQAIQQQDGATLGQVK